MRARTVSALVTLAVLVAGLAPSTATAYDSQASAAPRCFEHHKFGAQPVDVAKTADGQTVLAQVSWGYHATIGCYLTLDNTALATLRAAPPPQSLPGQPTDASRQCFEHHQFGAQPVDVAKTADGQTVLARLLWNRHATIGCYLTLDNTALTTLRTAHQQSLPDPDPTPDPNPIPDPGTDDPDSNNDNGAIDTPSPTDIEVVAYEGVISVKWNAPASDGASPLTSYTVAYKADAFSCPIEIDDTWTARTTPSAYIVMGGLNFFNVHLHEFNIHHVCVKANYSQGDSAWTGKNIQYSANPIEPLRRITIYDAVLHAGDTGHWVGSRGNLSVKLHVCTDPDLAYLIEPDDVAAIVEVWNHLEAPFYAWQSSGLFTLRMEPGQIIESPLQDSQPETFLGRGNLATECREAVKDETGVIHHFLIYSKFQPGRYAVAHSGGWGELNGFVSVTNLRHKVEGSDPRQGSTWRIILGPIQMVRRGHPAVLSSSFDTISHEIDHNISIHHDFHSELGETRFPIGADIVAEEGSVGTVLGRPNGRSEVYACYELQKLGWPLGEDKPACWRYPPRERNSFYAHETENGGIGVVWGDNSFLPITEPVTGQRLDLDRREVQEDGTFEWIRKGSYNIDADATSFALPPQPVGRYRVTLRLAWAFADNAFGGSNLVSVANSTVRVTPRLAEPAYGEEEPIELELSWAPAPDATHYEFSFEPHDGTFTGGSIQSTINPQIVLSESSLSAQPITRGESYDIAIFACGPSGTYVNDADLGIIEDSHCYLWATVTTNHEFWNSIDNQISQIPKLRFVPVLPTDTFFNALSDYNGPPYYIHWKEFPGASHYLLHLRECTDTISQCIPTDRARRYQLTGVSGRTSIDIFEYGKQYLIEFRACLPGQLHESDCVLWEEITFTTRTRAD